MNKSLKVILIIISIIIVGVVCFFIGCNVGNDKETNMDTQTTIQPSKINSSHEDLEDNTNTNVEDESFNDLTTDISTNSEK